MLDRPAHRVSVQGHSVVLALQEYRLLELLMINADHVVTSREILDALWGREFTGDPGTIAVHMLRLRKKLGPLGDHIETVWGVGYRLRPEKGGAE